MKRTWFTAIWLIVAAVVVGGCGGRQADKKRGAAVGGSISATVVHETRISIATGNAAGVYHQLGTALAERIMLVTGGRLRVRAAETGASVHNIQQLVAGTHQVAFASLDTATDAMAGVGAFERPQPVRALARLYDDHVQVVARAGYGIESLADLRGRAVGMGSPRSGTEVVARRLLRAAGLDPDRDVAARHWDLSRAVDGLRSGSIDAFFWSSGLPAPGLVDLFATHGDQVTFVDTTAELPKLRELSKVYRIGTIPAAAYHTPTDVPTVVVPNVLLVREDFDADLAGVLTKTLLDKKDALVKVNGAAEGLDPETAKQTEPIRLHPGAAQALGVPGGR